MVADWWCVLYRGGFACHCGVRGLLEFIPKDVSKLLDYSGYILPRQVVVGDHVGAPVGIPSWAWVGDEDSVFCGC